MSDDRRDAPSYASDAALDDGVDPERAREAVTTFLGDYLADTGASGYVLGVSGGLDSAVAATLAVDAVGADRVTGLVMPAAPSAPANMADARGLCRELGIDFYEVDMEPLVEGVADALPHDLGEVALGNVRARTRMVLWYADANAADRLVLGADNRSEILLGYFTKYGDGGVDVSALGEFYKTEVASLAREIGLDERFVEKTPTAGLWEGQTDAAEIGVPYATVDTVLHAAVDRGWDADRIGRETAAERDAVERVLELHRGSEHKRSPPPTPGIRR